MKSLFITTDFPPSVGGVAEYYKHLLNNFEEEVVVLTGPGGWNDDKFRHKIVREQLFTKLIWPYWLLMLFKAMRLAKKERVELIQVGQVLPVGTVALLIKKRLEIPYIVYAHGMDITMAKKVRRKRKLMIKILKNASQIISANSYVLKQIEELGINSEKISVINPAPTFKGDEGQFDVKEKSGLQGKSILLSVGRLVERKGFDRVIEAISYLGEDLPTLHYVIIGDGPEKDKLQSKIASAGLADRVSILPPVQADELAAWYRACDVFIMTSRQLPNGDIEGFGMVYLEANVFGKPVIATRTGGVGDAVIDNVNGLLLNTDDPTTISQAITKLMIDKGLRDVLGNQGRARVQDAFQWLDKANQLQRIIQKLNHFNAS